jgi:predicted Zn-dependent protease
MKSSWKTSLAGVASILTGLLALVHSGQNGTITTADITTALTAITAGVGLIFARDNNVSSEEAGATLQQKAVVQSIADAAQTAPTPSPAPATPKS